MTDKPTPTEKEIERALATELAEVADEVLSADDAHTLASLHEMTTLRDRYLALVTAYGATVRAEGRDEQDKHWTEVAQQRFEHVRPWEEMTGGFDDVAQFVLHEVWKRDPRVEAARAEGASEEREAVVRFLLERVAFRANGIPSYENIAEKIERGDHLKGDR